MLDFLRGGGYICRPAAERQHCRHKCATSPQGRGTREKELLMDIIKKIERENMRMDIPRFRSGDTVKVHLRIVEGEK